MDLQDEEKVSNLMPYLYFRNIATLHIGLEKDTVVCVGFPVILSTSQQVQILNPV
jgi:hypothetical protein